MTKNEIKTIMDRHIEKPFTTHHKSKRELIKFVNNSKGEGMKFRGYNKSTNQLNTIIKYLYFQEVIELLDFLKKEKQITFNQVATIVHADKKGGCITHIAIILITEFLNKGIADYESRIIKMV